jgi:hypothetical protein
VSLLSMEFLLVVELGQPTATEHYTARHRKLLGAKE